MQMYKFKYGDNNLQEAFQSFTVQSRNIRLVLNLTKCQCKASPGATAVRVNDPIYFQLKNYYLEF